MIARLVLRDRAIRRLLPWLLLGVVFGLLLSSNQQDAVRHGLTVGAHGYQGFRHVAYLPWGAIGLCMLYGGIGVRYERLDAALPISLRTLWLSRALALVLSAWALIGAMAGTLLLRNWAQGFQVIGRTQIGSLFAQLAAGSALFVVLTRLPAPARQALPSGTASSLTAALVWLGALGIVFLLAGGAPGTALLPGAVALGLGTWVYVSLPASPLLALPASRERSAAAAQTVPGGGTAKASRWVTGARDQGLVHTLIWRTCYDHWSSRIAFSMLLLLLMGVARADPTSSLSGPNLFVMLWLVLDVCFGSAAFRLHMLDPLPITRRRIFAYVVLPGLLAASLGYLGVTAIRASGPRQAALVDYRRHSIVGDVDVRVPFAFWEVSWEGTPAPVEEPYVPP